MVRFSLAFEGDKSIEQYPKLVQIMENYAFYSMQIYEHIPYKPAWSIVFHVAKFTKRLLIGPVTFPVFLYDPLTLARNLATLQELTNGRAMLGISRGAYAEYMIGGVDRSIKAVLKSIALLDAILHGEKYSEGLSQSEKERLDWLIGKNPEIYIGTSGLRLSTLASRLEIVKGIVVDNLWNPEYAKELRMTIDKASEEAGRSNKLQLIARPFTMIADNKDEATRRVMPILREYLPDLVGRSPMLSAAGFSYDELLSLRASDVRLPLELLENFVALGTPEEIVEQTSVMLKAGVDHVCYGHPLGTDTINVTKLIGEKIIPSLL